jgi:hemerythrin-like domain-containing protein
MEQKEFITSEGPLHKIYKTQETSPEPQNKNKELAVLGQKLKIMHDKITEFPDLSSHLGLSPSQKVKTQLREEYRKLYSEYQALKESIKNPINECINSSKKDIDKEEASLYPEKKSLFQKIKEAFSLRTRSDSRNVS